MPVAAREQSPAAGGLRSRIPRQHGYFNTTQEATRYLFWVSQPAVSGSRSASVHEMTGLEEVVRVPAEYDVEFLPAPESKSALKRYRQWANSWSRRGPAYL
ncbi:MAG: hypothetical protein ACTHQQ_11145 [Solirubrobacteraceae bacterium]